MTCIIVPAPSGSSQLDVQIIELLQTTLSATPWLEKCFGKAEVAEHRIDGVQRYPRVYNNTGSADYTDVRPDDALKAISFFEVNSPVQFLDENSRISVALSVVFWVHLGRIDPGRQYDYVSELAADVYGRLTNAHRGAITISEIETRPEQVFTKYTFQISETQYLSYPFAAFKISLTYQQPFNPRCFGGFVPVGGVPCV